MPRGCASGDRPSEEFPCLLFPSCVTVVAAAPAVQRSDWGKFGTLYSSGSQQGRGSPHLPRVFSDVWRLFSCHNWEELCHCLRQRPGLLLMSFSAQDSPPTGRELTWCVRSGHAENPCPMGLPWFVLGASESAVHCAGPAITPLASVWVMTCASPCRGVCRLHTLQKGGKWADFSAKLGR